MKSNPISLTVVVVAYNNSATLRATIDRVYPALAITIEDFSIMIVDDGSTDGTFEVAQSVAQKYPFVRIRQNARPMGQGYCITEASRDAETTFFVYVPGDNTWPLRSFVELFGHAGKADIITSYPNNLMFEMPPLRRAVSHLYSILMNLLSHRVVRYYNGLTIYPVAYFRRQVIQSRGFGFQAEALLKAIFAGYSFLEIALSVDRDALLAARTLTLRNIVDAGLTVLRLIANMWILRRGPVYRDILRLERRRSAPVPEAMSTRAPLTIVICGASSGIGAALARAMAADGHRVFICARRADKLTGIAQQSAAIEPFVCDVSSEPEVLAFVEKVSARADAVDVVVNCAGGFGEIGPVATVETERWWRTIEVNLKSAYLIARHMLPLLRKGRRPRIINFSGGGAFSPAPNYSAYACSKAAIVRLTECLAAELAPLDIRVNAIAPGFVPTEMHLATLAAGEGRAGRLQYRRTQALMHQEGSSIDKIIDCIRMMISPLVDDLTGKTISSNFDPWHSPTFAECLSDVACSDLYTMRRVNIVNLPDGWLRTTLSQPGVGTLSNK